MAAAFVAGCLVALPVVLVQRNLLPYFPPLVNNSNFWQLLFTSTILAGLVEEMAKFSIVLAICVFHHEFDEPVDGLIYMAAVAMGFTAVEDLTRHVREVDFLRAAAAGTHPVFGFLGLRSWPVGDPTALDARLRRAFLFDPAPRPLGCHRLLPAQSA